SEEVKEHCKKKVFAPLAFFKIQQQVMQREKKKEQRKNFITALDVRHYFGVNGMKHEEQPSNQRSHRLLRKNKFVEKVEQHYRSDCIEEYIKEVMNKRFFSEYGDFDCK